MQILRKNKKGIIPFAAIGVICLIALACGGLYAGYEKWFGEGADKTLTIGIESDTSSEGRTIDDLADMGVTCKWADKEVEKNVKFMDQYTSAAIDPTTLYVFKEKPTDWGYPTGDFTDYYKAESSSSGTMVLEENPGKYYVVVKNTTALNTIFLEVEVPCMGEDDSVVLNDYNQAPDSMTVMMTAIATLTLTDVNFAVSTTANTTTMFEVTKHDYTTVTENQCVVLDGVIQDPVQPRTRDQVDRLDQRAVFRMDRELYV